MQYERSSQKILEKFEFFPIRCRVQRAAEMFAKCMKEAYGNNCDSSVEELLQKRVLSLNRKIKNQDTNQKLKTKASIILSPSHSVPLCCWFSGVVDSERTLNPVLCSTEPYQLILEGEKIMKTVEPSKRERGV